MNYTQNDKILWDDCTKYNRKLALSCFYINIRFQIKLSLSFVFRLKCKISDFIIVLLQVSCKMCYNLVVEHAVCQVMYMTDINLWFSDVNKNYTHYLVWLIFM